MATDVDVQYFSHLNGLTLGNNWGDLIRLLDTCLVNGLPLTSITSASIDAQGDITLNLYAAHNCMLFQIVELVGFAPSELNGKYRIKGTPSATQLILKATHVGKSITTTGTAKLASLGYEIIFRDVNDVKRVYRAKNPTAQHPFIRVDETISDGVNNYTSTYAKSAMVGLLENMTHIDDYQNPNILQLPFDPSDPAKNWKITGTGTAVVRGWSRWHWARGGTSSAQSNVTDSATIASANRNFTLVGNVDAFWFIRSIVPTQASVDSKLISGCGLYDSALLTNNIPNWFLSGAITLGAASATNLTLSDAGLIGANATAAYAAVACSKFNEIAPLSSHILANLIMPSVGSGRSGDYVASSVAALQIPIYDTDKFLRGSLKHIFYSGNIATVFETTPILANNSMYIYDSASVGGGVGGYYFYIGELE